MFSGGDDGPRGAPGPSLPSPSGKFCRVLYRSLTTMAEQWRQREQTLSDAYRPSIFRSPAVLHGSPTEHFRPAFHAGWVGRCARGRQDCRVRAARHPRCASRGFKGKSDPAERRRRSLKRGHDLLDSLDKLKAALLSGSGRPDATPQPCRADPVTGRIERRSGSRRDRRPYRTPSPGRNGETCPGLNGVKGAGKLICPEIKLRPAAPTSVLMLRNYQNRRVRQIGPEPLRSPGFPMLGENRPEPSTKRRRRSALSPPDLDI